MLKKKILFVIDSLDCGGAEKSLVTLLKFIDYNQFEVDLRLHSRGGLFEKLVPLAVTVSTVEIVKGWFGLPYAVSRAVFFLLRFFNKKKHSSQLYWQSFKNCHKGVEKSYDIAIAYGQGFSTYYVADKVSAAFKYSWLNNDYIKAGYDLTYDVPFYTHFNTIVVVSEENEKVFKKCYKSAGLNFPTIVIRDIVDEVELFEKANLSVGVMKNQSVFTIATVGRLTPQKGLVLAIKACKILVNQGKNIVWYVVGEGEERNGLQELIKKNGLVENFILLGLKDNPYPYVRQSDLYVQSSIYEGLCITLIEAKLLQKPIVTTNFPSAYGIIEQDKTGIICEMNADAIAKSIARFMEDSSFMSAIVANTKMEKNSDKDTSLARFNKLVQH